MRSTIVIWAAGLAALAGLLGAGYDALKRPGDIHNPQAEFEASEQEPQRKAPKAKTVNWPVFGYDASRTKSLKANDVGPPLKKRWSWDSKELMEFSPVVANGRIYGINNDSLTFALDADTGKVAWRKSTGKLNASSPAFHKGTLYAVNLDPPQAFALRARDGKTKWSRSLPGRSESSPVIHRGKMIFGCECNSVFAVDIDNGKTIWQAPTDGAVKGPPAIADDKVYVGDYAGNVYAFSAVNGSRMWAASDQGGAFGRAGRFYSSPVVAHGRVYIGSVDGRVYSFVTRDGSIAWTRSTGDWVYSGVVAGRAKGRPAVFTGSFDENAYALDARTGEVIWSTDVGGRISGSGSIVGDVFYVSILKGETIGLDTDTGKKVFEYHRGQYNPVVSDGQRIYLTGYSSINALDPVKKGSKKKRGQRQGRGGQQGS